MWCKCVDEVVDVLRYGVMYEFGIMVGDCGIGVRKDVRKELE